MATTKHTCDGPKFGRKTPGCPRCDELIGGAAPVVQSWRKPRPYTTGGNYGSCPHCANGTCGPVCTWGDW